MSYCHILQTFCFPLEQETTSHRQRLQ